MQLLVRLRRLQIVVVAGEIGAAVLPVLVEEEIVEGAGEIVVMGDVALRLADRVVGVDQAGQPPQPLPPGLARVGLQIDHVLGHQIEHLIEVAALPGQRPVHDGFAEIELRIGQQLPMQGAVVDAQRRGRARPLPLEHMPPAVSVDQRQTAGLDGLL